MLRRQPPSEEHQIRPRYVGENKPKTSIIIFEAAKDFK